LSSEIESFASMMVSSKRPLEPLASWISDANVVKVRSLRLSEFVPKDQLAV
jgi:hypothetical protein